MRKLSGVLLELAEHALKQPLDNSSPEAVAVALLLAHVAWIRAVDSLGGDQAGEYRKVLKSLRYENPDCLRGLKSSGPEVL